MIRLTNSTESNRDYNSATTRNGSDSNPICDYFPWYAQYWFYMDIVCVAGSLTGNFLVMAIVFRNKKMRNIMNYLFVCMSASDILAPVFILLHDMFFILGYGGSISETTATLLCQCVPYFMNTSLAVSVLCLVAITVHRFYVVMFPFRALDKIGRRKTCVLIGLIWITAIATMSPTPFYWHISKYEEAFMCRLESRIVFDVLYLVFFRAVPLVVMATMYVVIIYTLRSQKTVGQSCSEREQRRRRKQSISMTKMSITIVFVFVIFIGSNDVFLWLYRRFPNSCIVHGGIYVTQAFVPFSTVINPVIYFIFCKSYRKGLKTVLTRNGPRNMSLNSSRSRLSRLNTGRILSPALEMAKPCRSSIASNAPLVRLSACLTVARGSSASLELSSSHRGSADSPPLLVRNGKEPVVLIRFEKKETESNQL